MPPELSARLVQVHLATCWIRCLIHLFQLYQFICQSMLLDQIEPILTGCYRYICGQTPSSHQIHPHQGPSEQIESCSGRVPVCSAQMFTPPTWPSRTVDQRPTEPRPLGYTLNIPKLIHLGKKNRGHLFGCKRAHETTGPVNSIAPRKKIAYGHSKKTNCQADFNQNLNKLVLT